MIGIYGNNTDSLWLSPRYNGRTYQWFAEPSLQSNPDAIVRKSFSVNDLFNSSGLQIFSLLRNLMVGLKNTLYSQYKCVVRIQDTNLSQICTAIGWYHF